MPKVVTQTVANTHWKFTIEGPVVLAEGQSFPDSAIVYNNTSGNLTIGEHTVPIGTILRMVNMSHMESL
jgi:hypothetical protein